MILFPKVYLSRQTQITIGKLGINTKNLANTSFVCGSNNARVGLTLILDLLLHPNQIKTTQNLEERQCRTWLYQLLTFGKIVQSKNIYLAKIMTMKDKTDPSYATRQTSLKTSWNLQWAKRQKSPDSPLCLLASRDSTRDTRNQAEKKKTCRVHAAPITNGSWTPFKQTGKPKWLGAKWETTKRTAMRRTGPYRTAGNRRPAACSLGPDCTWTRVGGAHCTWWRATRQRPSVCTPFCCGPAATSGPWAGSPCWTSCSLARLWACPLFRFCSHPWAA